MLTGAGRFDREWEIRRTDAPGDGAIVLVGDNTRGRVHHLLVEPRGGRAQLVALAEDHAGEPGVSGYYGTPDPRRACVLLAGSAVLLNVDDPRQSYRPSLDGPVKNVVEVVDDHVLLLATAWSITAIAARGVAWRTPRLSIESCRLDSVADHRLHGVADPDDERRPFTIDLRTGAGEGGSA